MQQQTQGGRFQMIDLAPEMSSLNSEVARGFERFQKTLPAHLLYDEQGAILFEKITMLSEYYPTRSELEILEKRGPEIGSLIGPRAVVVELGSGSCNKTFALLRNLSKPEAYMPVDISREMLEKASDDVAKEFPSFKVIPLCANFLNLPLLPIPENLAASRRVIFFPGSTIGNMIPSEAFGFLSHLANLLNPDDLVLVGVDLKKEKRLLDAAYNDSEGVTAAFNLNLLRRLNREMGANFDLNQFAHRAFYNEIAGRIEMHLVSRLTQHVDIESKRYEFRAGETIHTESSYKYSVADFQQLAEYSGLDSAKVWLDSHGFFSLHLLKVKRHERH